MHVRNIPVKTALSCTIATLALLGTIASATTAAATDEKPNDGPATVQEADTPKWAERDLSNCLSCHSRIVGKENSYCLTASHPQFSCFSCHDDEETLAKRHENATQAKGEKVKKLKKTKVSSTLCTTCHTSDELVPFTEDYKELVDANGTVVNPHELPQNEEHAKVGCVSCHKIHEKDIDMAKNSQKACASCHHANVFECNTCHD